MKKRKTAIRFLITAVSLLLICSMLSSCGIVTLIINAVASSSLDAVPHFKDIEYTRPDFEAIRKDFEDVTQDIQNGSSSFTTQLAVSNAYGAYNDAYTQYNIIQIQYYINVNDTEIADEMAYCAEKFAELDPVINALYSAIIDANLTDIFMPTWTERDFAYVEIQKKMFSEEYSTLMAERTELETQYMALPTTVEVLYKSERYSAEEFRMLYTNGNVSDKEYADCIQNYYKEFSQKAFEIYDRMIEIDTALAKNAGFDFYADYAYEYIYQRDYTPDDVSKMYQYVQEKIVPLYLEIVEKLDYEMLAEILTKEDSTIEDYDAVIKMYASEISPEMRKAYDFLQEYGFSAIGNSSGMQQAGFTTFLPSYEVPFIYLYTYGDLDDVNSFIHEFGHFFSYYQNTFESDNVLDVSEIQSQANEWLFMPYYDLTDEELTQYALYRFSEALSVIIDGCLFDEFQHATYETENDFLTYEKTCSLFTEISQKYQYEKIVDESMIPYVWSLIPHNFSNPFYYISYAMSAIPALEIYDISLDNREEAIEIYLEIIDENGFSEYLDTLKDSALTSPFDTKVYDTIAGISQKIEKEYVSD